uniref:CaMBD domain-containing protein n=1 Tax=Heterorhabditis bacteriophora TaxID=37862 RepID=A0A1I7X7N5_HETBA
MRPNACENTTIDALTKQIMALSTYDNGINKIRPCRFIHKYKKAQHKGDDLRLRHHQRRFLHSINEFRRIKWDQRMNILDNCSVRIKLKTKNNTRYKIWFLQLTKFDYYFIVIFNLLQLHSDMHETLWEMHRTQDHFISQIDVLTQRIIELQNTLVTQSLLQRGQATACSQQLIPTHSQCFASAPTPSPSLPNQQPLADFSQTHREPLQQMNSSTSIPRISVAHNNNGPIRLQGTNGSLPQCTVDQLSSCPTGGVYATVTTPLMHSFEEV